MSRSFSLVNSLAMLLAVSAADSTSYSTATVSSYTTELSSTTTYVDGKDTFTVTGPTTLTLTDGPYTRTHTFVTEFVTVCPSSAASSDAVAQATGTGTAAPAGDAPVAANSAIKTGISLGALGVLALALL